MGRGDVAAPAITLALCLAAAGVSDCRPAAHAAVADVAPPRAAVDAVVLVTIDGTRWQEIFDGVDPALARDAKLPPALGTTAQALTPNLHRLFFDEGEVIGNPLVGGGIDATAAWHVSMPGYVELSTGAGTDCVDNACKPVLGETIADAVAAAGGSAAVIGSWSEIARAAAADPARIDLSTGRGEGAYPLPGGGAYRPDHGTMEAARARLREGQPRFLWIALGDTDEHAHAGNYRGYLESIAAADRFIGELVTKVGERTAIFVTADHGRDPNFRDHGGPSSGAVWLLARGPFLRGHGETATAQRRRLRDVAPTMRALLGLPARACPGCGEPIEELLPVPVDYAPTAAR
jgi:hypothetical protein